MSSHGLSAGIQLDRWYGLLHLSGPWSHRLQLFDLTEDRACGQDLANERPDVARRLRRQLVTWLATPPDGELAEEPASLDAQAAANLAALGYSSGSGELPSGAWLDPGCECSHCEAEN